jgi:hypothetical protein
MRLVEIPALHAKRLFVEPDAVLALDKRDAASKRTLIHIAGGTVGAALDVEEIMRRLFPEEEADG